MPPGSIRPARTRSDRWAGATKDSSSLALNVSISFSRQRVNAGVAARARGPVVGARLRRRIGPRPSGGIAASHPRPGGGRPPPGDRRSRPWGSPPHRSARTAARPSRRTARRSGTYGRAGRAEGRLGMRACQMSGHVDFNHSIHAKCMIGMIRIGYGTRRPLAGDTAWGPRSGTPELSRILAPIPGIKAPSDHSSPRARRPGIPRARRRAGAIAATDRAPGRARGARGRPDARRFFLSHGLLVNTTPPRYHCPAFE